VERIIKIVAPNDDLASNLGELNQATIDTLIKDLNITKENADMLNEYI
jgi:hypothetical protein